MDLKINRVVRYLLVGGFSYLIEMLSILLLKSAGLSSVESVAISFWIGLVAAFILQKYIAFQNFDKDIKKISKQLSLYLLLVLFNYIFSIFVIYLLDKSLSVYLLRTLVIILCTLWNYFFYKKIFNS